MSETNTQRSGGIGFLGLLAILFIGLKLGGIISWSWLWVLAPLWIPLALVLTVLLLGGIVFLIYIAWSYTRESIYDRRYKKRIRR